MTLIANGALLLILHMEFLFQISAASIRFSVLDFHYFRDIHFHNRPLAFVYIHAMKFLCSNCCLLFTLRISAALTFRRNVCNSISVSLQSKVSCLPVQLHISENCVGKQSSYFQKIHQAINFVS